MSFVIRALTISDPQEADSPAERQRRWESHVRTYCKIAEQTEQHNCWGPYLKGWRECWVPTKCSKTWKQSAVSCLGCMDECCEQLDLD